MGTAYQWAIIMALCHCLLLGMEEVKKFLGVSAQGGEIPLGILKKIVTPSSIHLPWACGSASPCCEVILTCFCAVGVLEQ